MTNFAFDDTIPATGHNPSVDYITMQQNNVSSQGIIDVDHIGYNQTNGGTHRQCQFADQIVIPAGLMAGFANLYGKLATEESLFFSPGSSGKEYQLTRTDTSNFTKFATNTAYSTSGTFTFNGGWTFLPGGMLLQYGKATNTVNATTGTIPFPKSFTNTPYAVLIIPSSLSAASTAVVTDGSPSTTGFSFTSTSLRAWFWIAVGV